jgi:hypothetical protein
VAWLQIVKGDATHWESRVKIYGNIKDEGKRGSRGGEFGRGDPDGNKMARGWFEYSGLTLTPRQVHGRRTAPTF